MSTRTSSGSLHRRSSRSALASVLAAVLLLLGAGFVWAGVSAALTGAWPVPVEGLARWLEGLSPLSTIGIAIAAVLLLAGLALLLAAVLPGGARTVRLRDGEGVPEAGGPAEAVMSIGGLARLASAEADLSDGVESVRTNASARKVRLLLVTPLRDTAELRRSVRERVERRLAEAGLDPVPKVQVTARTKEVS